MFRIWGSIHLVFLLLSSSAAGQGLRFATGDFDAALAQAQKEGKMLLLMTTGSFSEASTVMVEEVMAYKEVGDFFNPHFLGWVLDAEPLAPDFVFRNFRLLNIPEYIFIDVQGEVQFRGSGYLEPGEMIALGKRALDEENHASQLQALYEAGDRSPGFMQRYILTMEANGKPVTEIGEAYLAGLNPDDLYQDANWQILSVIALKFDARECRYVLANYRQFCDRIGKPAVQEYLLQVYDRAFVDAVQKRDKPYLQRAHQIAEVFLPDGGARETTLQVNLAYDAAVEDWTTYQAAALEWFGEFTTDDPTAYNDAAFNFYLHVEDRAALETALSWANQSIAQQRATWNLHTRAALLHKLGRKAEAQRVAEEALELAGPDRNALEKQFEFLKQ